ncbi:MAG: MoxR family ATPase [Cytophagaceae bacterium]|nr:MoxR family ATPase [Cytophagaceae bacterium]
MLLALHTIPTDQQSAAYLLDPRLQRAVELAYALDKPLLVSGEPGTGKTQLARKVADLLAGQTKDSPAPFLGEPIEFHTKSSASATDLFYTYDAVSHFRSKPEDGKKTSDFIDFTALGRARVLAHGRAGLETFVAAQVRAGNAKPDTWARIQPLLDRCAGLADTPRSSVVLIDEVDKAPREFPNDLLNEMESGEFRVRELDFSLKKAQNAARVLVILTSNFEKSLPNAFLRRCVFYHIPFPDDPQLLDIVNLRLGLSQSSPALGEALRRFRAFRDQARQSSSRVPSTAEFLDWLRVLKADDLLQNGAFPPPPGSPSRARYEASLVLVYKEGPLFLDTPQDQSSALKTLLA